MAGGDEQAAATASGDVDRAGTRRTALLSVFAAAGLVALKLGAGLLTGSLALVSAGVESSGDVVAAVLTLFAVRLGGRPADVEHPYGHRRAENLAALGEAAILAGAGIFVLVEALGRLASGGEPPAIRWYLFVVTAVAVCVDATRTTVSFRAAAAYSSAALRSNAFHFASDFAGSLIVLGGLVAVGVGLRQGDAIAALLVAVIVFSAAARLVAENARVLMDTTPARAQARAEAAITALGEAVELRRLRVRESGGQYFADAVVAVAPGQAIVEGEAVSDAVEAAVHGALPDSDVVVHLEPRRERLDLRDRALSIALSEPHVREAHDIVIYEHAGRQSVSLHLKMDPTLSLAEAHEVAQRVEAALAAQSEVAEVHTHLEPLERPLPASVGADGTSDEAQRERIVRLVVARTGHEPRELRLLHTDGGLVVFVSAIAAAGMSLRDAHELAGRLEDDIRAAQPHMADVVVHTEP